MKKHLFCLLAVILLAAALACAPVAASALTMAVPGETVSYDAGYTTITWEVFGDEPSLYIVAVEALGGEGVTQQAVKAGETKEHSLRTVEMIPGKRYKVYVLDENNTILGSTECQVPDVPDFQDGKMTTKSAKISMEPRRMRAGGDRTKETKKIKKLVAREIEEGLANGTFDYGLRYTIKMPQLAKGREFFTTIALESPDGFLMTAVANNMTFKRVNGGYQTISFYLIGDSFFSSMYKKNGKISTGDYKVYLYWDGMWVNTSTFKVN